MAASGVYYAARYVRLTRDLARAANVQAEQARTSASAAADQAHISRQIFEAAHRPSIEVMVDFNAARFFQNADNYTFPFRLHNHGSVPAILVGWRGTVRVTGHTEVLGPQRDAGYAIFPSRPMDLNFSNVHGPQGPTNAGADIEIAVQYHSPSAPGVVYTTRMVAAASDNWRATFPELT